MAKTSTPQRHEGKDTVLNAIFAELKKIDSDFMKNMLFEGQGTYTEESIRHEFAEYMPDEAVITRKAAADLAKMVKAEWKIAEAEHPFAVRRGHYAIIKGISDHVQMHCDGTDEPLSAATKDTNKAAILAQIKAYPDYYPLINQLEDEKISDIYDLLGAGKLTEYKKILEDKDVTDQSKSSPEDKIAFWKPLAALLGAVGIAYAASPGKEEREPTAEGEEPKKQSWFKPVIKWLGIAAAVVSAVELGYSLAGKSSPIVGPATAKLFKQRNTPATGASPVV